MFIYKDPNEVPLAIKKMIYIQENALKQDGPTMEGILKSNNFSIKNLSKLNHSELDQMLLIYRT